MTGDDIIRALQNILDHADASRGAVGSQRVFPCQCVRCSESPRHVILRDEAEGSETMLGFFFREGPSKLIQRPEETIRVEPWRLICFYRPQGGQPVLELPLDILENFAAW